MENKFFDEDFRDNPVLGTLSYIAPDVDAETVNNFHRALDNLTAATFPKKYEMVNVQVTARDYDGRIFSILKCDKIFDLIPES